MLYKFKSRAAADLIMLEAQGRQVLKIIGKDPAPRGIVTAEQIPAAIAALEEAVRQDEARRAALAEEAGDSADADAAEPKEVVHLRQRVAPFIEMLRRTAHEGYDLVWGA